MQFVRSWMNPKEVQEQPVRGASDTSCAKAQNERTADEGLTLLSKPCGNLLDADAGRSAYIFRAAQGVADCMPPESNQATPPSTESDITTARTGNKQAAPPPPSHRCTVEFLPDDSGAVVVNLIPATVAASETTAPTNQSLADSASSVPDISSDDTDQQRDFERPDPLLAKAFLSKVGSIPPSSRSNSAPSPPPSEGLTANEGYKRYATDLAPYYLAEYSLQGVDVNIEEKGRAQAAGALATSPWLGDAQRVGAAANGEAHDFSRFVVPLLQAQRPNLAQAAVEDVALLLQPEESALKLACQARAKSDAEPVSLMDLLYDDAFVHSLLNWKLQPSNQAKALMRFLLEEVSRLHASGATHGALGLQCVFFSVAHGWHLSAPPTPPAYDEVSVRADTEAVARILCFLCLSPTQRKEFQPHRLPDLSSAQLLKFVEHIPALKIMSNALINNPNVRVEQALSFYFWHDLPIHAQVINDAKAVIRSMRLGSEEFDRRYNSVVLGGSNWRDALGAAIVPAIVTASREHVHRRDFSAYDFASAASLVRFVANTVCHFEELPLGLAVTRSAFLQVLLAAFPALVPCCYHYLASCPAAHVHNRDSDLVFNAIVESSDSAHKLIHDALAGCSPQPENPEAAAKSENGAAAAPALLWDLKCLESFHEPPPVHDNSISPSVIQAFAAWKCPNGPDCPELADATCIKWHDERELRFAQEHLCIAFMEDTCKRTACPNAHGFAEIRGAMNDTSPICWKWLECNCKVPHCRYAHTFRRHHGDRLSRDSARNSISLDHRHRTPRSSIDSGADRKPVRGSVDSRRSHDQKRGGAHAAGNGRRSTDHNSATSGSNRSSLDQRRNRDSKSFETAPATKASTWVPASSNGRGGTWVKPKPGAPAADGGSMQPAAEDAEAGWTKAPARKSGRNSYGSDRPPVGNAASPSPPPAQ